MTTITVQLQGKLENLKDALVCAAHYSSTSIIVGNVLTLSYICETSDRDQAVSNTQDCIDPEQIESLNVELVSIS